MVSILSHSAKGTTWKKHKYINIINGRYIYPKKEKKHDGYNSPNTEYDSQRDFSNRILNATIEKINKEGEVYRGPGSTTYYGRDPRNLQNKGTKALKKALGKLQKDPITRFKVLANKTKNSIPQYDKGANKTKHSSLKRMTNAEIRAKKNTKASTSSKVHGASFKPSSTTIKYKKKR